MHHSCRKATFVTKFIFELEDVHNSDAETKTLFYLFHGMPMVTLLSGALNAYGATLVKSVTFIYLVLRYNTIY